MSTVQEIKDAIEYLPPEDYEEIRFWLREREQRPEDRDQRPEGRKKQ